MKRFFLAFFASLFYFTTFSFADASSDINSAMRSGNARLIGNYFNNNVELNLPGNEGLYSKVQAELLLKDFFTKNPPRNFTPKHEGLSQDGSKYSIGTLESPSGVYRTYFYLKSNGGSFLIKEFRIEKER